MRELQIDSNKRAQESFQQRRVSRLNSAKINMNVSALSTIKVNQLSAAVKEGMREESNDKQHEQNYEHEMNRIIGKYKGKENDGDVNSNAKFIKQKKRAVKQKLKKQKIKQKQKQKIKEIRERERERPKTGIEPLQSPLRKQVHRSNIKHGNSQHHRRAKSNAVQCAGGVVNDIVTVISTNMEHSDKTLPKENLSNDSNDSIKKEDTIRREEKAREEGENTREVKRPVSVAMCVGEGKILEVQLPIPRLNKTVDSDEGQTEKRKVYPQKMRRRSSVSNNYSNGDKHISLKSNSLDGCADGSIPRGSRKDSRRVCDISSRQRRKSVSCSTSPTKQQPYTEKENQEKERAREESVLQLKRLARKTKEKERRRERELEKEKEMVREKRDESNSMFMQQLERELQNERGKAPRLISQLHRTGVDVFNNGANAGDSSNSDHQNHNTKLSQHSSNPFLDININIHHLPHHLQNLINQPPPPPPCHAPSLMQKMPNTPSTFQRTLTRSDDHSQSNNRERDNVRRDASRDSSLFEQHKNIREQRNPILKKPVARLYHPGSYRHTSNGQLHNWSCCNAMSKNAKGCKPVKKQRRKSLLGK